MNNTFPEVTLTEDDFDKKYTYNETLPCDCFEENSGQFETYGKDMEVVQNMVKENPKKVWTVIEGEEHTWICAGYRIVNRNSFIITNEEWTSTDEEYQIDDITDL